MAASIAGSGSKSRLGMMLKRPKRPPHRRMHDGIHRAVVAELDLRLGRVDVDVDLRRVQLDEEEPRREGLARHQLIVGLAHRMVQVVAADEAAVHEEVLLAPRTLARIRACPRSRARARSPCASSTGTNRSSYLRPKSVHDALPRSETRGRAAGGTPPARCGSAGRRCPDAPAPRAGTRRCTCFSSTPSLFRNWRRAGTL